MSKLVTQLVIEPEEIKAQGSSQKLFVGLGDIGIQPIFFKEVNYCKKCESTQRGVVMVQRLI